MSAGTYNFTIEQGATFHRVLTWKDANGDPVDLTGYTAQMQVLHRSRVVLDFGEGSRMTLGGAAGTITWDLTDEETDALAFITGVYDLNLISGGETTRLLKGGVRVAPRAV